MMKIFRVLSQVFWGAVNFIATVISLGLAALLAFFLHVQLTSRLLHLGNIQIPKPENTTASIKDAVSAL